MLSWTGSRAAKVNPRPWLVFLFACGQLLHCAASLARRYAVSAPPTARSSRQRGPEHGSDTALVTPFPKGRWMPHPLNCHHMTCALPDSGVMAVRMLYLFCGAPGAAPTKVSSRGAIARTQAGVCGCHTRSGETCPQRRVVEYCRARACVQCGRSSHVLAYRQVGLVCGCHTRQRGQRPRGWCTPLCTGN